MDWDKAGSWDYELRRLRISFSKKKFKRIKTLASYNDELGKLIGLSDELAPSRSIRRRTPFTEYIRRVQDHACSLHRTLKAGWRCPCQSPHIAILRLEKRLADDVSSNIHFRVRFGSDALSIPWHATEIRVLELDPQSTLSVSSSSSAIEAVSELKRQVADMSLRADVLPSRFPGVFAPKPGNYNSGTPNGLVNIFKT